jgi:hypothetical protein
MKINKNKIIFLIIAIIFLCTGCRKNQIKDLEGKGLSATYTKKNYVNCDKFADAVSALDNFFITNKGELYRYDINKLFDNNQNCKMVDWEDSRNVTYTSIFEMKNNLDKDSTPYVISDDGSNGLYMYTYSLGFKKGTTISKQTIPMYYFKRDIFGNGNIYQIQDKKGIVKNGSLDEISIDTNNRYGVNVDMYKSTGETLFRPNDDEKIIKILDSVIFTNNGIYNYTILDRNCLNYVDSDCKLGFKRNFDLTERKNDIIFMDQSNIIFKDGSSYQYVY